MRFFASLIVLVPLVCSVVALPASTQDISTILSYLNTVGTDLQNVVDIFASSTDTDVEQFATRLEGGLTRLTSDITALRTVVEQTGTLLFYEADGLSILQLEAKLFSPIGQLEQDLADAGTIFNELGFPAFELLIDYLENFGNEFEETSLAIQKKLPGDRFIALLAGLNNLITAIALGHSLGPI
ncbi:uncharacterized protein LACBIDRAFT_330935 [Laccaria bicolor S238N-H82]|uniref:Predicted protein n=1 Tax=Laccaria bicolor (strain S238N-H82 / ATCC MYA-4686) TaxID=486041 RepID=B0DMQ7_LACBS|nr:uncharacterized protein LACBIDRAFT_330935 [Laccaria bicolor S238N-H82]EDR04011.1 predicted protein [Laccaria bicolor S238N-H82]|eukprot:XP_001885266.1 predicted protein [Laccaria bicolor S238N-H82]